MPEIIYNMPDPEYRAIDRLSKHDSDDFDKNPYAFFKRKASGYHKEPTEAMKLGTALHTHVLQPHLFDAQYAIIPASIKAKRGKEWDEFEEEHKGKELIKQSQFQQICEMSFSLKNANKCKDLFEKTPMNSREVVLLSEIEGVEIKSKADMICVEHGTVVDVKTASDASPDAFMSQSSNFGYDVQAAWYLLNAEACGLDVNKFEFLVVESEYPYTTASYSFSRFSDFILAGENEVKRRLARYKNALTLGPELVEDGWVLRNLELPPWNKRLRALREGRK